MDANHQLVGEMHHRVKNTLQNIISYINLMFSANDQVSKKEIEKLIHFVHNLSSLYDLIHSEVQAQNGLQAVRFEQLTHGIITEYSSNYPIRASAIPSLYITTSCALTLCLCLNELLDLASRIGAGTAEIMFTAQAEKVILNFKIPSIYGSNITELLS